MLYDSTHSLSPSLPDRQDTSRHISITQEAETKKETTEAETHESSSIHPTIHSDRRQKKATTVAKLGSVRRTHSALGVSPSGHSIEAWPHQGAAMMPPTASQKRPAMVSRWWRLVGLWNLLPQLQHAGDKHQGVVRHVSQVARSEPVHFLTLPSGERFS